MNEPLFPCTNALQTPNPSFWTTKTAVPKFPENGGSTPTLCLDKAVHAQGGGGGVTSKGSGMTAVAGGIGGAGLLAVGGADHPLTTTEVVVVDKSTSSWAPYSQRYLRGFLLNVLLWVSQGFVRTLENQKGYLFYKKVTS